MYIIREARVTMDTAEEITTTITNENPDDFETLAALEMAGGLAFVTYKTHIIATCHLQLL